VVVGSSRGTYWEWVKGFTLGVKYILRATPEVFQHITGKGFGRGKLLQVAFKVKQRWENGRHFAAHLLMKRPELMYKYFTVLRKHGLAVV